MTENTPHERAPAPLGSVEPHAHLLNVPPEGQLLYKVMTVENLLSSIADAYLHFNCVDSYQDFPNSDIHDGQQLPEDQPRNTEARFARAPKFSIADYYDRSRIRTYACCFSLENSDHIWTKYANDSEKGKVCIVFDFGKFRATLNQSLGDENAVVEYNGNRCHQIFSVNYGNVEYVDWDSHQVTAEHLPNPIMYTYLKDKKFSKEKELRVSLSALGIGDFALNDGSLMNFPNRLKMAFDFRAAIADGTIPQILFSPKCDSAFLQAELRRLHIIPREGSDLPLQER